MDERRVLPVAFLHYQRRERIGLPRGGAVSHRVTRRSRRFAVNTPVARRAANLRLLPRFRCGKLPTYTDPTCRSNDLLYSPSPEVGPCGETFCGLYCC
jgi:hypothetical protein